MSTTAHQNAPRLISRPHYAGQTIVFRSPHALEVLLVDVAKYNSRGHLEYVAANNPAVEKVAIQAYRALNSRLNQESDIGFFSKSQCLHFCVNHAVRQGAGLPSSVAASDAVEWVTNTLALPHEQAVEKLIEARLMPASPEAACTQELIGRVAAEGTKGTMQVHGFLVDAYNGLVSAEQYPVALYLTIYENPDLIHLARTLPEGTIKKLQDFAKRMPTDLEGNFLYSESFLKQGQHKASVIESLNGFREGCGLQSGVVMAALYNETGDTLEVVEPSQIMSPTRLASLIEQHGIREVDIVMTPEGNAPALTSPEGCTLLIERIDGSFATADALGRLVQRHELICDDDHYNTVGLTDHTASKPMRMG